MERTIKVSGTGNVKLKPDKTIISMSFSNVLPSYDQTLKASARDIKIVKEAFEKAGIEKASLKTKYFNVDTHYESYRDENNNYKSRFDGFEYSQSLIYEFGIDNVLLGKILYQLSLLPVHPEFRIAYGIKDANKAKNELLSNAVKDAKEKAKIIAHAANLTLDEIITIDYSWVNVEFISRDYDICGPAGGCEKGRPASIDIDIEPDDIEKSDDVSVVFKVK